MTDTVNVLVNKKVKVKPIVRSGGWLDKGHDGEFMFSGCKRSYVLPIDAKRGTLVSVFKTKEEQIYFERELSLKEGDLSSYKKEGNFWKGFRVEVNKDGLTLDLSDPMDYLRWKVLGSCPEIAPSWAERFNSGEYRFALCDEDQEVQDRVKVSDLRKTAYKFLGTIEGSVEKMSDMLRLFGRKPAKNNTREWFQSEIDKIIEDDKTLVDLIKIIKDPYYEMKLFIEDALDSSSIKKIAKGMYCVVGLDTEFNQQELMEFLNPKGKNQDTYLKIKGQISDFKNGVKK